jgi:hypothetical protein
MALFLFPFLHNYMDLTLSACEKKEDVSQSEAKITDSSGIVQSEETEKTTKDDEFTIENGVLLKYMGDSKDVVIPDGVAKIGANAFESCESLTSVEIPNTVTEIEDYAFQSCKSLTSVEIPSSVTKLGTCAFCSCTALTNVEIPDSVSEIGPNAFTNTPWLDHTTDEFVIVGNHILIKYNGNDTDVKIPDTVTKIAGGFADCDWIISVEIPDSVTEIGNGAFSFCTSLTNVKMSTENIKIGDSAFLHTPWGDENGYNG